MDLRDRRGAKRRGRSRETNVTFGLAGPVRTPVGTPRRRNKGESAEAPRTTRPKKTHKGKKKRGRDGWGFGGCFRLLCRIGLILVLVAAPYPLYLLHQKAQRDGLNSVLEMLGLAMFKFPESAKEEESPAAVPEARPPPVQGLEAPALANAIPRTQVLVSEGPKSHTRALGAAGEQLLGTTEPAKFAFYRDTSVAQVTVDDGRLVVQNASPSATNLVQPGLGPVAADVHLPHSWNQDLAVVAETGEVRSEADAFPRGLGVYSLSLKPFLDDTAFEAGSSALLGVGDARQQRTPFLDAFRDLFEMDYVLSQRLAPEFWKGNEAPLPPAPLGRSGGKSLRPLLPPSLPIVSETAPAFAQAAAPGGRAGVGRRRLVNDASGYSNPGFLSRTMERFGLRGSAAAANAAAATGTEASIEGAAEVQVASAGSGPGAAMARRTRPCLYGGDGHGGCVRVFFKAGAAAASSRVFLQLPSGPVEVGRHDGAYTGFEVDLSEMGHERVQESLEGADRVKAAIREATEQASSEDAFLKPKGPAGSGLEHLAGGPPAVPPGQLDQPGPIGQPGHVGQPAIPGQPGEPGQPGPVALPTLSGQAGQLSVPGQPGQAPPVPSPGAGIGAGLAAVPGPAGAATTIPGGAPGAPAPAGGVHAAPGAPGAPLGPAAGAAATTAGVPPPAEAGPASGSATAPGQLGAGPSGGAADTPPQGGGAPSANNPGPGPSTPEARVTRVFVQQVSPDTLRHNNQFWRRCSIEGQVRNSCDLTDAGGKILYGLPGTGMYSVEFFHKPEIPLRCSQRFLSRHGNAEVPDPAPYKRKACYVLQNGPAGGPPSPGNAGGPPARRRLQVAQEAGATSPTPGSVAAAAPATLTPLPNLTPDPGPRLTVLTSNLPDIDKLPGELVDWFVCGGLSREASLVATGPLRIAHLHPQFREVEAPGPAGAPRFSVDVEVLLDIDELWRQDLVAAGREQPVFITVPLLVTEAPKESGALHLASSLDAAAPLCVGEATYRFDVRDEAQKLPRGSPPFAPHLHRLRAVSNEVRCRAGWKPEAWRVGLRNPLLYAVTAEALWLQETPESHAARPASAPPGEGWRHELVVSDRRKQVFGYTQLLLDSLRTGGGGRLHDMGEPVLLKGTHLQEDGGPGVGCVTSRDQAAKLLDEVVGAGFNMVRLAHYPHSQWVFDAAMRRGVLVWVDLPWYRGGLGPREAHALHIQQELVEMVLEHRSNPAIFAWGLGNEMNKVDKWEMPAASQFYAGEAAVRGDEGRITELLRTLHRLCKALDPSRLTGLRAFKAGKAIVDVYSPSIWPGWYSGRYVDYEDRLRQELAAMELGTPGGPAGVMHLEWGATAMRGAHANGGWDVHQDHGMPFWKTSGIATAHKKLTPAEYSESYQTDLANWILRSRAHGYGLRGRQDGVQLMGDAMWLFRDSRSPQRCTDDRRATPALWCTNAKGIVTVNGERKDAFYIFQSMQRSAIEEPVCFLESPTWTERNLDQAEQSVDVRVYTNCALATLSIDERLGERKARNDVAFPAAGLVWSAHLSPGSHTMAAECHCPSGSLKSSHTTQVRLAGASGVEAAPAEGGGVVEAPANGGVLEAGAGATTPGAGPPDVGQASSGAVKAEDGLAAGVASAEDAAPGAAAAVTTAAATLAVGNLDLSPPGIIQAGPTM